LSADERLQLLSETLKPGKIIFSETAGNAVVQAAHLLQLLYHQVPAANHNRVSNQNNGFDNRIRNLFKG
jgi:hypothetical protein